MLLEKVKGANIRLFPQKLYYGPTWLVLGVNNICNLHCKMCDVGTKNMDTNFAQNLVGTHPMNMPIELFRKIVDQSAKYYPKSKIAYAFTEPLIYPHLIESLEYAQSRNRYTAITTNALNLKQKADDLLRSGLNEIFISLDGPQDIHNEIRGHKSSFQRAVAGMEKLLETENPPHISVFCVITEWNIGYLREFLDFFKPYPLKQLGFMHMNFTPQHITALHNLHYGHSYPATDSNMDEIDIDRLDLDLLLEEIHAITAGDHPFPVTFSPEIHTAEKLNEFYRQPEKLIGKRCKDIFSNIMIKSDGSVIPAHGRCFNIDVGNVYEMELNDIWNSVKLANFRKGIMDAGGLFPACSRCCSAF